MNFGYFFDQTKNERKPLANVRQWLDKNTFNSLDYNNLYALYSNKHFKTISIVMPALNEESTVGTIIETIFQELNKEYQIIDEFILIDGGSTDRTLDIVDNLTKKYDLLKLVQEKDVLPKAPFKKGKGNQLWKGLECSSGDIVLYCDSDLKNFDIRMIYGLIGPLLLRNIQFVKGFYERPLVINDDIQKKNEGGRVTELCARPMINLFYPDLSGFIQPLGGEYGGYRNILENVQYMSGYGVEVNLLIEIYEKYGLNVMGQVDLLKREHRHQNTSALSKMSFIIMNTILSRTVNKKLHNDLLMKNFTQVNDNNFKNNVSSDKSVGEHFLLLENIHDDVIPPLKEYKNTYSIKESKI